MNEMDVLFQYKTDKGSGSVQVQDINTAQF